MRSVLYFCAALALFAASSASGQTYVYGDIGFADTDFETSAMFSVGGGYRFTDTVSAELGYNDFGDAALDGIDFTSLSLTVNWGGDLGGGVFVHSIFGVERLDADGDVFGINIDASSTEFLGGVGATIEAGPTVDWRLRLLARDSGDLLTATVGVAIRF